MDILDEEYQSQLLVMVNVLYYVNLRMFRELNDENEHVVFRNENEFRENGHFKLLQIC